MGLENLKSVFAKGVGNNSPQIGGRHGEGGTAYEDHFTKLDDGLGNSIYNPGMNDSQFGVGGKTLRGNITTLDDGVGRFMYNVGKDDSVHGKGGQSHTIHQHDKTLLDEFTTLPEVYGVYQSSFSLYNNDEINYSEFPSYVNLNDNLRNLSDLQYIRTPFETAGNNLNGGLYSIVPEPDGSIDFTSIADKRKTFYNSPFFSTNCLILPS